MPKAILAFSLCMLLLLPVATAADDAAQQPTSVTVKTRPDGSSRVELRPGDSPSDLVYVVRWNDGRSETFTPDSYARLLYKDHRERSLLYRMLNITTPMGVLWVSLGLLGQVLFTGRMVVQWLTSEKNKRSVIPVAFWWMSLAGGLMLLIYFIWRKDIVGIIGQSTGVLIYARNLMLIKTAAKATPLPAPVAG